MCASFKEVIPLECSDCEYILGGETFPFGSVISVLLKHQDPVILQLLVLAVCGLPQQHLTQDIIFSSAK